MPGIPALLGLGIFIQWGLGLFWGAVYVPWWETDDPYINAGWTWVVLLLSYCAWAWLIARQRITDAGAPGFLVVALGLNLKVWGDFLWVLPDPHGVHLELGYEPMTGERAFDPAHLPCIVGTARYVGLAAVALGFALVLAFAIVDLRRPLRRVE